MVFDHPGDSLSREDKNKKGGQAVKSDAAGDPPFKLTPATALLGYSFVTGSREKSASNPKV